MQSTRVDTKKLKAAIKVASEHLDEASAALAPFTAILTDADRAAMPRAREGFGEAGRALARAAAGHPEIAAVSGFDAEAITEDLDNVRELSPLVEQVAELSKRLSDTRLAWLAEAWVPSLAMYAVAKVRAKTDGKLRTLVAPLAEMFAVRRARREPEGGAPE
jgi:hypothetical protein